METLFELKTRAERLIEERGLERFKTLGAIGVRCGFLLGMITPRTPATDQMLRALDEAIAGIILRPDARAATQLRKRPARSPKEAPKRRASDAPRRAPPRTPPEPENGP